ncbi:hypothetical protein Tco_0378377 [Tanacetum coccineum]
MQTVAPTELKAFVRPRLESTETPKEQPHDDQDIDNHEGENEKKKQKLIGESSLGKELVTTESTHHDTQPSSADQPHKYEMPIEEFGNTNSEWLGEDNTHEYDWFNRMVDAHKDLKDDDTPPEGSIVSFAKQLMKCLKIDKLAKDDLKIIKRDGFKLLKNIFKSNTKFEYNLEQLALAMSKYIDYENPESNIDLTLSIYTEYIPNLYQCKDHHLIRRYHHCVETTSPEALDGVTLTK